jgi:hypothetical protein
MNTFASLLGAVFILTAPNAHAQNATENCRGYAKPQVARVLVPQHSHAMVYDAAISDSPYHAGDVVAVDSPVIRMIVPTIQEQLTALSNRITDDRLRLGDLERIVEMNRLELGSYHPLSGESVSEQMRRKILRSDEIDALQANIASLTEQQRKLERVARTVEGRFARTIYLLTDPPPSGEIAKAGSFVFDYVYLNALYVAIHSNDLRGAQPAPSLAVQLDDNCVIANYVSSTSDKIGTGSELVYRALINAKMERTLVPLFRTPRSTIVVFER